jgi:DNA repair photolyase
MPMDEANQRQNPGWRGRGAGLNPANRFESLRVEEDPESEEPLWPGRPETRFLPDATVSIITRNDSPDVGFERSLNPYRGCEHGCIYCFARPTHEYLGYSAGIDFETRIMVKERAPELLRQELSARNWEPQVLVMSGVTDCYQPVEKRLGLTRACLEVLAEFRNPVAIITKNHLVCRDVDLLGPMAEQGLAAVNISITSLKPELTAILEPRTSRPALRLEAVRVLAKAGVPVNVMVAPVIPGINEEEIPAILEAVAEAGAVSAAYTLVRLPLAVAPLFEDWLERHFPTRKKMVLARLRDLRGGRLNDPRFGSRLRGEGIFAEQMRLLFKASARRSGLDRAIPPLRTDLFRVPGRPDQLSLF